MAGDTSKTAASIIGLAVLGAFTLLVTFALRDAIRSTVAQQFPDPDTPEAQWIFFLIAMILLMMAAWTYLIVQYMRNTLYHELVLSAKHWMPEVTLPVVMPTPFAMSNWTEDPHPAHASYPRQRRKKRRHVKPIVVTVESPFDSRQIFGTRGWWSSWKSNE